MAFFNLLFFQLQTTQHKVCLNHAATPSPHSMRCLHLKLDADGKETKRRRVYDTAFNTSAPEWKLSDRPSLLSPPASPSQPGGGLQRHPPLPSPGRQGQAPPGAHPGRPPARPPGEGLGGRRRQSREGPERGPRPAGPAAAPHAEPGPCRRRGPRVGAGGPGTGGAPAGMEAGQT